MSMPLFERQVESKTLFEGRIVRLRVAQNELPDGTLAARELVDHPGGVGILPVDADGNAYMVRQFRAPFGAVLLELPAGKLEYGEDPLACGARELKEEVGAEAAQMRYLGCGYSSPGFCNEIVHLYLATGLRFGETHLDEEEFLECEKIPLAQLVRMTLANEIADAKTQLAILKAHALIWSGEVFL